MKKKLVCFNHHISEITKGDTDAMFDLFCQYYSNVSREQFEMDLLKKEYVFILRDKKSFDLKGFSTIVQLELEQENKLIRGFFSGDTVVDKEYWGQGALGVSFLKFLFMQKLKKPLTPLYWFLISKGYKTYLLMANNFSEHYPRYEKKTPANVQNIIDTFSTKLYGNYYDKNKGLITYSQHASNTKDCLKGDVTPISKEMMLKNKRIQFFATHNPDWQSGDELACIAKMTLFMPLYYQFKVLKKMIFKKKKYKIINDIKVTQDV